MIQLALGIIELLLLTFDYTVPVDKNVFVFFYKQEPVQE